MIHAGEVTPLPSRVNAEFAAAGDFARRRAVDVEVFHRRDVGDGGGTNGVLAVRDGGEVLYEGKNIAQAVRDLMGRDSKPED